jgi:hypothetical protein
MINKETVIDNFLSKRASLKIAELEEEREVRLVLKEVPEEVKSKGKKEKINQVKLWEKGRDYIRVRQTIPGSFWFTRKDLKKMTEDSIEIPEELFDKLYKLGTAPQEKTRYKWKGWDVDELKDESVFAEYELPEGIEEVEIPSIFEVLKMNPPTVSRGENLIGVTTKNDS